MEYCMLLWPHSNARYQNETLKLAESELRLLLNARGIAAEIGVYTALNLPALLIRTEERFSDPDYAALRRHSLLYGLFERKEDGSLLPVAGREAAYIGSDLPGILKYKGKTNELFLQLLLNAAFFSGTFDMKAGERPEFLDPMCGRATSLFVGANMGWNVTGSDVDKNDLNEADRFLKRYFEYHRMKHGRANSSRTAGGKGVPVTTFTFSDSPEHYRANDCSTLTLACTDAAKVRDVFGKNRFHVIAADLPYGVQHGAVGGTPASLLERALPAWKEALRKGGCVAVSFNAQTLRRAQVLEIMAKSGLKPLTGDAYDGFEHWVEQAVTRDLAVARKE